MATCKFNIGDTVRRINDDNHWYDGRVLKVGTVCTVVKTDGWSIDVKFGDTIYNGNDSTNFELVEAAKPKCKFKIGDEVVGNHPNRYAYTNEGWKGRVVAVHSSGTIDVEGKGNKHSNQLFTHLDQNYFDLVNNEKIVITHDGKVITATLYGVMGNVTATARCAPEDTFDFRIGAEIAMGRLVDKLEESKYYNGKVVCISNRYSDSLPISNFTVGKVYEVVYGLIVSDTGYRSERYKTLENLCVGMGHTFIPIVE